MCPLCPGCWAMTPLGALTHFYEASKPGPAQHLQPSAFPQPVLFPEPLHHAIWAEAEWGCSIKVFYRRKLWQVWWMSRKLWRSKNQVGRWGGNDGNSFRLLQAWGCLGLCERRAYFQSWVLAVHSISLLWRNWLFGICLHIGCLIQR